jgi:hypothetical protein
MILKEFIIKNNSEDVIGVVKTEFEKITVNPNNEVVILSEGKFVIPNEIITIKEGKRRFFKINEKALEIDEKGKPISKEMTLEDIKKELNKKEKSSIKAPNSTKPEVKEINKVEEVKKEEPKASAKTEETKVEEVKKPEQEVKKTTRRTKPKTETKGGK